MFYDFVLITKFEMNCFVTFMFNYFLYLWVPCLILFMHIKKIIGDCFGILAILKFYCKFLCLLIIDYSYNRLRSLILIDFITQTRPSIDCLITKLIKKCFVISYIWIKMVNFNNFYFLKHFQNTWILWFLSFLSIA